jgi:bacterioferritin-associated ferredoxin
MENCCERRSHPSQGACPSCGHAGREVDRITLKALLRPEALVRLCPDRYRFCPATACPIVYFRDGEVFRREDVQVPVFQKETEGIRTICYCFGISEDQIRREVGALGSSASAERIKALVQSDRCACEVRNPQGTCCLGNVMAVAGSPHADGQPLVRRPLRRGRPAG